ncbi:sulfatase-like hydrolase/transferase [Ruegeria hyattellae]|uniref:sulfatase-like hydrolase/transferase n=1 Tax=Ruegeria hyattellae TaxID=3233337 RepID=UPI00355B5328
MKRILSLSTLALMCATGWVTAQENELIHDAEYGILKAQNGERWLKEDEAIDTRLAEIRAANGGKPPNIIYVLLDDVGFGEIGMHELSVIRGYNTPNIDAFAKDGLSLMRMYTEPSCTPTRVAMMTGRLPTRTGLVDAKATLAGEGLPAEEVTLAEVLKEAGYTTSHVGKWHMGDIEEAYAHKQGFMNAEFPIHQQGQMAIMHADAEDADVIRGTTPDGSLQTYTLDAHFAVDPSHMVTGVELRDGKIYEVDLEPGEPWSQAKYRAMNERYQQSALSQLRTLAEQDEPFFLNYWPLFPLNFPRQDIKEFKTLNGGTIAETIVEVDEWLGDLVAEVDKLGIAENTVIMIMGDNGPFMKYAGATGISDRIYRGAKGDHLEGGVRVNAYVRWKGVIEPSSYAEDIIHVSDLFTTFARLTNASEEVPTDRIIDGLDQSSLLLNGDTHGRRDYVFVYEGSKLKSVVKNKYKMHLAPAGANPILFSHFFDLYRDPREERSKESIKYGPWAGGQFANMIVRHQAMKKKYPDRELRRGIPYTGIENLRPETEQLLEVFKASLPQE